MIDYGLFHKIQHLYQQKGLNRAQIARELNLDPRTVEKWLNKERFTARRAPARASKLDPYRQEIMRLLASHPYTAMQIYQRLREQGFTGGYWIVRRFVRSMRPRPVKAYLTLSFAPGECAQVDWGSYGVVQVGRTQRRLSFFVMVLCHSRLMYVAFTPSQTMEFFMACHQNAFQFFGAVPQRIMVDNLKSAVLRRIMGEDPVLNARYLDFAQHYGFDITACGVGKGNEKGRVENGVGYVKKNFLKGLTIPSLEALNPGAHAWLKDIANQRIHGETRRRPCDMLCEDLAHMKPLNENIYDVASVKNVRASKQFRVTVDTNRYSVPAHYAGALLTLKSYPDYLCVYDDQRLVARHPRSFDRHQDFEDPDHVRALITQRKKARDQVTFRRFLSLSKEAGPYYQKLEQKRLNAALHVRKIVALSEIYGVEAVAGAMQDAMQSHAFSAEYIANILHIRSQKKKEPGALHLTRREDLLEINLEHPDLSLYSQERSPSS